jgi:hypothetical protein
VCGRGQRAMTIAKTTGFSLGLLVLTALGCGSSDDAPATTPGAGAAGGSEASGGASGSGAGGSSGKGGSGTGGSSGKGGSSGSSGSGGSGSQVTPIPTVPGEPCNSVDSALPEKPCMVNVAVKVSGNAANISFDPVDGAADYRVYELPADGDVTADGDNLTVKNALYRCAGTRQAPPVAMDGAEQLPGGAIWTRVDDQTVGGYRRSLEEATLGYVSAVPGDGLVPVYALGDSSREADNVCYFMRWSESRAKRYVTSEAERDELLAQSFRDDGIAFYVPAEAGAGTRQVFTSTDSNGAGSRFYFADGPEAAARSGATPAFSVFTDASAGIPLMRVFYDNACGMSHDELVGGMARFERAREQGDKSPMTHLHWSGLNGDTTLVIEALADGCPNLPNGLLAPISIPSRPNDFGHELPAWLSLEEARALSPDGELYVNGQFDPENKPRPIARSFVKVKPAEPPDLDWFQGFDTPESLGELVEEDCGNPVGCSQQFRHTSAVGDVNFIAVETDRHVLQSVLGELWVMYEDWASDTPGKFRLTANEEATLSEGSFLYVTMEVNAFTTARRYPQFIISDQQAPVQWNLVNGRSLVIQTFGDWPYVYELEVCDHRTWDVNDQCPKYDLYRYFEAGSTDRVQSLAPNPEVGEHTGVDRSTQFEVWVSPSRAYLYLDGLPYGCVDLPEGAPGAGPVSVTFGDTLYHSGVDALDYFSFMKENYLTDTRRHFDNLGFKSGVGAPPWDEERQPCVNTLLP